MLLVNKETATDVKLIDFGLAKKINKSTLLNHLCGTKEYMAPELKSDKRGETGYSFPVDMWSLGVILYVLLSGVMPFTEEEDFDSYTNDVTADDMFQTVSPAARDLIQQLLDKNPDTRITAAQAVKHAWFKD